jgi:nitrogenase molybdenum-iron protein alpha chain
MLQIAQRFGKTEEARLWIEEEHKVLAPALEDLRRQLKGKRVFVGASLARAVSLSALSADLGFELVGLSSFQSDGRLSIANILHYEQANVINRLKPDLYIARGLTLPHASLFGVPMISLYDHTSCNLGYRGTLSIGQRMANALKNPSFFTKLSHHVPLPYRQSWYSQDPFKYLRSENEIRFNY